MNYSLMMIFFAGYWALNMAIHLIFVVKYWAMAKKVQSLQTKSDENSDVKAKVLLWSILILILIVGFTCAGY